MFVRNKNSMSSAAENDPDAIRSARRGFLSGKLWKDEIAKRLADQQQAEDLIPTARETLRLTTRAMACDFTVIMNPLPHDLIWAVSEALDHVHVLEAQYTVYREHSELLEINRRAGTNEPVHVEAGLYQLLKQAVDISSKTAGAYNPLMHPLIQLWRTYRERKELPPTEEVKQRLALCHVEEIEFSDNVQTVYLKRPGMGFNLGGIGKGHAVDVLAQKILAAGIDDFLLHGGQSSVYSHGIHGPYDGWPVGIKHPNLPNRRIATLLLKNQAMSTSGSGVQFFRHGGKKYGHILDPRTGWSVDSLLSATLLTPTAAQGDALSTAIYVAQEDYLAHWRAEFPELKSITVGELEDARSLEAICTGVDPEEIYWETDLQIRFNPST
jgi:thiamine biosynthesis lipoprotein